MDSSVVVVMPEPAPHAEFEGPEFKDFKNSPSICYSQQFRSDNSACCKHETTVPSALCTSCGKSVMLYTHYKAVVPHPVLKILMCRKCHGFYHSGKFTQDEDGIDEQCKWCGEGGQLLMCDFCSHAFCEHCIKRNFGIKYLKRIHKMSKWHCLICNPNPLKKKIEECKRVMERFYTSSLEDECLFPNYLNENNKTIDAILSPLEKGGQDPPLEYQGSSRISPLTILKERENYKVLSNVSKPTVISFSDNEYKGKILPENRNSDSQVHHEMYSQVDERTEQETLPPEEIAKSSAKTILKQKEDFTREKTDDKFLEKEAEPEPVDFDDNNKKEPEKKFTEVHETSHKESEDHVAMNDLGNSDSGKEEDMDETPFNVTISSPRTASLKEKLQKAESLLSILQHLVDECDADIKSQNETQSRPYFQYKSTSNLLKKVKKVKLSVAKMENRLQGKKKRLKNIRPSLGSDNISDSSSGDEMPSPKKNKRLSSEKKHISTEPVKKEASLSASPESSPPSSWTISDPVNKTNPKDLVNCELRVPLKKLTQDEIRKFSRKRSSSFSTTTAMNSSSEISESGGSDDTDSSKAVFRRCKNSENQRLSHKSNREPNKLALDPIGDSDSTDVSENINDSDYFDASRNDYSRSPSTNSLCPDNDIAKNLLLQKMKHSSPQKEGSDSDIDELDDIKKVNIDSANKARQQEEINIKALNESGSSSNESVDKENHVKSYKHPLLMKTINPVSKENKESLLSAKRKKESSDENIKEPLPKAKKTERKLIPDNETTMDDDSDLSTDSDFDEFIKKPIQKTREKRRIVLSSDLDSDFDIKKETQNEDSDSYERSGNSSAAENVLNESANLSDDNQSTENELEKETLKLPKKKRRRVISFDSDNENNFTDVKQENQSENEDTVVFDTPSKPGRKNIRKIQEDENLSQPTKQARKEEFLRRQRLENERENVEEKEVIVIEDEETQSPVKKTITVRMVLSKNPLVEVDPLLLRELKPHQLEGVRFLWENLIERISDVSSKPGGGCILAHCMGLGKTLQAITFLYTVLTSEHLEMLKTALILCPIGTVLNWKHEFKFWLSKCKNKRKLKVYEILSSKNTQDRIRSLENWSRHGGVMIMGYGLFRTIMADKNRSTRQQKEVYQRCLNSPGPDMFICDEGHILKNEMSSIAQLVRKLKTKRRIILTGTPLQNNMVEYHCMVSIVKPQLLGTLKEFKNRFINPIENGQHVDSTESDVKLMKKRAHVLHELLAGCVQRKDYTCLRAHLNPKFEYVLNVRLSDLQIRLYRHYIGLIGNDIKLRKSSLFSDFNIFLLLASHPACLTLAKMRREDKENQEDVRNFINDDESEEDLDDDEGSSDDSVTIISDGETQTKDNLFPRTLEELYAMSVKRLQHYITRHTSNHVSTKNRQKLVQLATKCMNQFLNNPEKVTEYLNEKSIQELKKIIQEHGGNLVGCTEKRDLVFRARSLMGGPSETEKEWYEELIPQQRNLANANCHSGKILLMLEILRGSTKVGDKVVIFSQSLISLDLIENVLKTETENVTKGLVSPIEPYSKWYKNKDYFRLDGSTPSSERNRWITYFNSPSNQRCRLFIISTRAGGVGINLIGANRAIVFDASWNPTNDVQSIFRIYRFGQQKPCYIYRFIAQGTMEEKIYERQVIKQSLAFRVVDEQQIVRHFTARDLAELYSFKPAPKPVVKRDESGKEIEETPHCAPPKDDILASIIKNISTRDMIVSFHEHDSLLDHQVSEELTDAERRAAWEEYDNERRRNEQLAVDPTSRFAYMPIAVLSFLLSKAREAVAAVTKAYNEFQEKSMDDFMTIVQLENRAMSTEEVSERAAKLLLDHYLTKSQLIYLKRVVEKKHDEVEHWYLYRKQGILTLPSTSSIPTQPQVTRASDLTSSDPSSFPSYNPTYSTKPNPYPRSQNSSTSGYTRPQNFGPGYINLRAGAYTRPGNTTSTQFRPPRTTAHQQGSRHNSAFTRPSQYNVRNPRPQGQSASQQRGYTPFRPPNSSYSNLHAGQYMNGYQNKNMNPRMNNPRYNMHR